VRLHHTLVAALKDPPRRCMLCGLSRCLERQARGH
jgi:hypothetical protein